MHAAGVFPTGGRLVLGCVWWAGAGRGQWQAQLSGLDPDGSGSGHGSFRCLLCDAQLTPSCPQIHKAQALVRPRGPAHRPGRSTPAGDTARRTGRLPPPAWRRSWAVRSPLGALRPGSQKLGPVLTVLVNFPREAFTFQAQGLFVLECCDSQSAAFHSFFSKKTSVAVTFLTSWPPPPPPRPPPFGKIHSSLAAFPQTLGRRGAAAAAAPSNPEQCFHLRAVTRAPLGTLPPKQWPHHHTQPGRGGR